MALTVNVSNTGDPENEKRIRQAILEAFPDYPAQLKVSILGAQNTTRWELLLEGAGGFKVQKWLIGETGEHRPGYIVSLMRDVLKSVDASLALLRTQGFLVGPGEILAGSDIMTFRVSKDGSEYILSISQIDELRMKGRLTIEGILALDNELRASHNDKDRSAR